MMKAFAIYNKDSEVRAKSSSGGVFSILAERILNRGGIVYGAAFNNSWEIEHIRVDNLADLAPLRGSKYAFSNFAKAINQAQSDLKNGKEVLFCGTPCQIAALHKYVSNELDNLFAIEIVCHGVPEHKFWIRYLNELCKKLKVCIQDIDAINFRDKSSGWKTYSFSITLKDGRRFCQHYIDNIYMRAFLSNYLIKNHCFNCQFKYPHGSVADLMIGDFWGVTQIAPEIDTDEGLSLVIVRTKRGEELIRDVNIAKSINLEVAAKYNPAIISPPRKPKDYDDFIYDSNKEISLIKVLNKYAAVPIVSKIKTKIYKTFFR